MNSFERLKEMFGHFPGIGPRQAERFAYYLLGRDVNFIEEMRALLSNLKRDVTQCDTCMRFFSKNGEQRTCSICNSPNRDKGLLMIVSKDNDLKVIESSAVFNGTYFVLGGIIPILEKTPEKRIRFKELINLIKEQGDTLKEVILALSATHEGEHTGDFIGEEIKKLIPNITISHLGRGLSTGLEIEYSDTDTIKAALQNKF